jgi:hypothetical protein
MTPCAMRAPRGDQRPGAAVRGEDPFILLYKCEGFHSWSALFIENRNEKRIPLPDSV